MEVQTAKTSKSGCSVVGVVRQRGRGKGGGGRGRRRGVISLASDLKSLFFWSFNVALLLQLLQAFAALAGQGRRPEYTAQDQTNED